MISTREELIQRLRVQQMVSDRASSVSLSGYLDHVIINSVPEPRPFAFVRQPWQTEIYTDLDRALEYTAGVGPHYGGPRHFWYTLPRGHDKTSAIARRLSWLLGYSRRYLHIATAAADEEQASLITEMMHSELSLNPWLGKRVAVHKTRAYGKGGLLKILNSHAGSTWGLNCDVVILDEVTWWENKDLFDVLLSGNAKRDGIFVIISNAGVKGSWQHDMHTMFSSMPDKWHMFSTPEGVRLATWMSEDTIAADSAGMPVALVKRIFGNRWVDPGEESGYLVASDVEACEALGRQMGLGPVQEGIHGVDYFASVDYGPKRDRTALCVLHFDTGGRIRVDLLEVWQGDPTSPIQIRKVKEWLDDVNARFHRPTLVFDPYQMEGTAQEYEYNQNVVRFEAHGGKSNYQMAANLRSLIVNRQLVWYPTAGDILVKGKVETFKDELTRLVFVQTPYGYRFDHAAQFHDDRTVAVGMAAIEAAKNVPSPQWVAPKAQEQEVVDRTKVAIIKHPPRSRGLFDMDNQERKDIRTRHTRVLFQ